MNIKETLAYLYEKGILSQNDFYTICKASEANSISLSMQHPLIIVDVAEKELGILRNRMEKIYRNDSSFLLLNAKRNILRLSIEEFNNYNAEGNVTFIFDSRKAVPLPARPYNLEGLKDTMKTLLSSHGCPWDKAQDHMSLRTYFIQEVYEVIDAIEQNDVSNMKEELGDVLFQIVFHATLAEQEGHFSMQEIEDAVNEKMIRRHPFVFDKKAEIRTEELPGEWENRKKAEKSRKYLLSGVPKSLPSLLLACIIQKKVSSEGLQSNLFSEQIFAKYKDLIKDVLQKENPENEELKTGAILFAINRVFSELGIDTESCLHQFSLRYIRAVGLYEDFARKNNKTLADLTPEEIAQIQV